MELRGIEPLTSCMPCRRSPKLSYNPIFTANLLFQIYPQGTANISLSHPFVKSFALRKILENLPRVGINVKLSLMKKTFFIFAILILPISAVSSADQNEQVITLKDGSQIKGTLAGVDNGVYTVKTPIIGDVHVSQNDVASITNGNVHAALPASNPNYTAAPSVGAETSNLDQQIAAGQQRLLSNPQSMALLQQMAQNPEIIQTLQDPALVQAITTHDYQAVQNNPAVQKLLANPQMLELIQKLAAQQRQQNTPSQ